MQFLTLTTLVAALAAVDSAVAAPAIINGISTTITPVTGTMPTMMLPVARAVSTKTTSKSKTGSTKSTSRTTTSSTTTTRAVIPTGGISLNNGCSNGNCVYLANRVEKYTQDEFEDDLDNKGIECTVENIGLGTYRLQFVERYLAAIRGESKYIQNLQPVKVIPGGNPSPPGGNHWKRDD
ncbi:hypothetical protein IWQ60_008805 [Tieghemiomyces parasiticus]|uniref:Uncharacterized protein n=1 Tax=Tieghemiomyces parasiticus TaxID=78921 RepID=A0A9W7ZRC6_9FUNG|nr:hypothetical protein IWQ60_008805 [Tieghemiomyces parasiticus]